MPDTDTVLYDISMGSSGVNWLFSVLEAKNLHTSESFTKGEGGIKT